MDIHSLNNTLVWTSAKLRFAFIHIPKNAGTSIKSALAPHLDEHCLDKNRQPFVTSSTHNSLVACDKIHGYYHFACVRNTFDRVASHYYYSTRTNAKFNNLKSFYEYLCFVKEQKALRNQVDFISIKGKIAVEKILSFENLQAEFDELSDELGIPHVKLPVKNHQISLKGLYPAIYGDREIAMVFEYYARDIETFGHKFTL